MADYHVFYVNDAGSPKTGLAPTWSYLKNVDDGTDYSQPSISEVGGGWYKYELNLNDFEHVVGVVDAGAALTDNEDRYIEQDIRWSQPGNQEKKEIIVTPSYDEDTLTLSFEVCLLINGVRMTTGLTSVTLTAYDENHNQKFSINTSSFTNGVAILTTNNPTLTKNKGYYILPSVVTSLATYGGAETYVVLE